VPPATAISWMRVGKRYRRHDEIGTPYCVTVDAQTLADGTVTVRDRDSMTQLRLSMNSVVQEAAKQQCEFEFPRKQS